MKSTRYRTVLRVERIDTEGIDAILPGWHESITIRIDAGRIPASIWTAMQRGRKRFFCKANIGEVDALKIHVTDYEE